MYDNTVNEIATVSQQLRQRRQELGLSLADVARRAGTSAATLSRYENGWTRFETYTLRKLAVALGCELRIELHPKATGAAPSAGRAAAVERLGRLFWDRPLDAADLEDCPVWVLERVLDYGNLEDVHMLQGLMGRRSFLDVASKATRVSPRTQSLWRQILELEGMQCTTRYSRHTAWNS